MKIKISNANAPVWKDVTVKSRIPEELKKLEEMARNIWWAWNYEATELFKDLDPVLWKEAGQNPVVLLERLSYEKLEALAADKDILKRMNDVYAKFRAYMDAATLLAKIFSLDPTGLTDNGDLTAPEAELLRQAAKSAVWETPAIPNT